MTHGTLLAAKRRRRFRARRELRFEQLESRRMMAAFDVLVFWEGSTHTSTHQGVAAIQALGTAHNFSVSDTNNSTAFFTAESLAQYEAVIFLNTEGDVLNAVEEAAFQAYVEAGGGFVGIHSAAAAESTWAWFGTLLGTRLSSQSAVLSATVKVADAVHASTAGLPERWTRTDQWLTFNSNPRGNVHVLATLDESSFTSLNNNSQVDHPISWYRYVGGGRSWYTAMGHTEASYAETNFLDHLLGGIEFAAGRAPADLGATVNSNWQKTVLVSNPAGANNFTPTLQNPVNLAIAPTGEVFVTELWTGKLKVYDPADSSFTTAADLDVFRRPGASEQQGGTEDGLTSIAIDPNFSENGWVYLFYSPAGPEFFPLGTQEVQYVSRFTYDFQTKLLDVSSEKILLEIPVNRVRQGDNNDGHTGGGLAFGPDGTLYISVGDDTNPHAPTAFNYAPIDEQPGNTIWDAQRTSSNTNDLRGKILRIKPEDDGTYSIPNGNLFAADATHRPEIYVMGNRNPYRIAVDSETGWLYWGEVGPDAGNDSGSQGPRGYDEINQAREAGNFGWPYVIADNKPYNDIHWTSNSNFTNGPLFDPDNLQNDSPNNSGAFDIPDAESAFIWYPYTNSLNTTLYPFPEMRVSTNGTSGRLAAVAGVYHFDATLDSDRKLSAYYDGTLIIFDWSRNAFWEVKLDQDGNPLKINRMFPELSFSRPIAAQFGPDGALYVLEWGSANNTFGGNNNDAKLVRIDFVGNLPALLGDYNQDRTVDAADYTVWRNSLGHSGLPLYSGADGSGNGSIGQEDYRVWKTQFGVTLAMEQDASLLRASSTEIFAAATVKPNVTELSRFASNLPEVVERPLKPFSARSLVRQPKTADATLLVIESAYFKRDYLPSTDSDAAVNPVLSDANRPANRTENCDAVFESLGTHTLASEFWNWARQR